MNCFSSQTLVTSRLSRHRTSATSWSKATWRRDEEVPQHKENLPGVQRLNNCCSRTSFCSVDHSFFGSEWKKRWCALTSSIFYYFGSEKGLFEILTNRNIAGPWIKSDKVLPLVPTDKQQKGSFHIIDYNVQLVTNLRRDSKKTSCFELFCPGRSAFQVCMTTTSPDRRPTGRPCSGVQVNDVWVFIFGRPFEAVVFVARISKFLKQKCQYISRYQLITMFWYLCLGLQ